MPHSAIATMKNRIIAVFFAFFGGVLGLHKMYLRGFSAGSYRMIFFFLAILFRWPFVIMVLFIMAVIEGILLATMPEDKFNEKYNSLKSSWSEWSKQSKTSETVNPSVPRKQHAAFFSGASKWVKSGSKKFKDYDMKGALADFLQAVALAPNNPTVHFNLACTYSILEDASKGFYHLEQAIASGFKEQEKIALHDSLAFLRIQPEFPDFVANGYRMVEKKALHEGQEDNLLEALRKLNEQRQAGEISEMDFKSLKEKLMG